MAWSHAGAVVFCAIVAVALLAPGASQARTALSFAVALPTLAVPWLTDGAPVLRYALSLLALVLAMKTLDLARAPMPHLGKRLLQLVVLADLRLAHPTARRVHTEALRRTALWSLAALVALAVAIAGSRAAMPPWPGLLLRWGGCVSFGLAAFEVLAAQVRFGTALLGVELPKVHDEPWRSRSVREFWGARWNRMAGAWLRAHVYLPLAPRLGVPVAQLAVFCVSAAVHWYLIAASLGLDAGALMAAFFVVQGSLLQAERWLRPARWPDAAARAWTLGALALSSPLVAEPMMRMLDPLLPPAWR